MKIFIASDHAGFELKEKIISHFKNDFSFEDLGPTNAERVDYPDFAKKLSGNLLNTSNTIGVLVCGSGQGMVMTANKFAHIRAALCTSTELAELSRAHNDANVLCLGARTVDEGLNLKIFKTFVSTSFEGGRHKTRVDKINTKN